MSASEAAVFSQAPRDLGEAGLRTWRTVLSRHAPVRGRQVYRLFDEGIRALGLTPDRLPDLREVNRRLAALTGFEGVFVDGLEDARGFYALLRRRRFPIGNFIRDERDLSYTPAPDIVHDLYGHLPFLTDRRYADFCQRIGELAWEVMDDPQRLRQIERFFWFTIEFALVRTEEGLRVFGAGIASSIGECEYALSGKPELRPFDVDAIRAQEFRIDQMQPLLFVLESPEQLYDSLPALQDRLRRSS